MDFWIPLLGGALGAAIINGIFAYYKLKHDKLTEHDQWRRNQRQTEYAYFLEGAAKFVTMVERINAKLDVGEDAAAKMSEAHSQFADGITRLGLVAPQPLLNAALKLTNYARMLLNASIIVLAKPSDAASEGFNEAWDTFQKGAATFTVLARQDLGLLTESKDNAKAMGKVEADLLANWDGPRSGI